MGEVGARALVVLLSAVVSLGWSVPAGAVGTGSTIRPETSFADVSCTSATNCTAVGSFGQPQEAPFDPPSLVPVHATETDGVWSRAVQVTSLGDGGGLFTAVSCPSAGNCTAVGFNYSNTYDDRGYLEIGGPIYERETDGKWGPVRGLPNSAVGAYFSSVSCGSATSCTAVGTGGSGAEPMFATESGGTFGRVNFVTTPTGSGFFASVSCTSAVDCTAVGGDTEPFLGGWDTHASIYATKSAGTWGTASEIPASGGFLSAVSCISGPTCISVGGQTAVTEAAGSWGAAKKIADDGVSLSGVDCSSSADCTAVGEDSSDAYGTIEYVSIHVTEKMDVWGPAKADGGGEFSNVSCPSATACTSVGSFDLCTGVSLCDEPSIYPVYAT